MPRLFRKAAITLKNGISKKGQKSPIFAPQKYINPKSRLKLKKTDISITCFNNHTLYMIKKHQNSIRFVVDLIEKKLKKWD